MIFAKKIGMTTLVDENDKIVAVTVLEAGSNSVVHIAKPVKIGGVEASPRVQLGFGEIRSSLRSKALCKHMSKSGLDTSKTVCRVLGEFSADREYQLGEKISVEIFSVGDFVKVRGISKGKGYQGAMKRHGFHGGRASHGASMHRALGSTGGHSYPAKKFKGKKMAGHTGCENVTTINLQVAAVDAKNNLLFIRGAVPGVRKGIVRVQHMPQSKKDSL